MLIHWLLSALYLHWVDPSVILTQIKWFLKRKMLQKLIRVKIKRRNSNYTQMNYIYCRLWTLSLSFISNYIVFSCFLSAVCLFSFNIKLCQTFESDYNNHSVIASFVIAYTNNQYRIFFYNEVTEKKRKTR